MNKEIRSSIEEEIRKLKPGSKERIFFEKVMEKFGPNFVRKSLLGQAIEARNKLDTAMTDYFKHKILADAMMKAVNQQDMSQTVSSKVHPFYLSTVKKYLPADENSPKPKLFGLTQKDIPESITKQSQSEHAELKKLIEDNIKDFCIQLVEYTGGSISDGDWKSALDRILKDLEHKVISLSNAEKEVLKSRQELQNMMKIYFEELIKGISVLNSLLLTFMDNLELECETSEVHLLKSKAVMLKSYVFQLNLLLSMYNCETMPALKKISSQLDQSEEHLKDEHAHKKITLEGYLKLGENFEQIAEEFTQLTKSIEDEQWMINKLTSWKPPDETKEEQSVIEGVPFGKSNSEASSND